MPVDGNFAQEFAGCSRYVRRHGGITGITSLASGYDHVCAVVGGRVYCWGDNFDGQLGIGNNTNMTAPQVLPAFDTVASLFMESASIATSVVSTSGAVWTWGDNGFGELGDGTTSNRKSPFAVPGLTGATAAPVGSYGCALRAGGVVSCWGKYSPNASLSPSTVAALAGATNLSSGGAITTPTACAVIAGQVLCWGSNTNLQLGDGTMTSRATPGVVLW